MPLLYSVMAYVFHQETSGYHRHYERKKTVVDGDGVFSSEVHIAGRSRPCFAACLTVLQKGHEKDIYLSLNTIHVQAAPSCGPCFEWYQGIEGSREGVSSCAAEEKKELSKIAYLGDSVPIFARIRGSVVCATSGRLVAVHSGRILLVSLWEDPTRIAFFDRPCAQFVFWPD